jgi:hypothetical protein
MGRPCSIGWKSRAPDALLALIALHEADPSAG